MATLALAIPHSDASRTATTTSERENRKSESHSIQPESLKASRKTDDQVNYQIFFVWLGVSVWRGGVGLGAAKTDAFSSPIGKTTSFLDVYGSFH